MCSCISVVVIYPRLLEFLSFYFTIHIPFVQNNNINLVIKQRCVGLYQLSFAWLVKLHMLKWKLNGFSNVMKIVFLELLKRTIDIAKKKTLKNS